MYKEKIYTGRAEKVIENRLREKIRKIRDEIRFDECRKAIASFRKRLQAVCEYDGGDIERLFR